MRGAARTVLCVGLTVLDVVHHLERRPDWGVKQRAAGGELVAGGPAANAAVTAARLLGGARLLTAVGAGPLVGPVRADLDAHGVELIDLAPPGWPLPVSSALVELGSGERTVVSPGALGPAGVLAPEGLRPPWDGVGAVLLDGHHPKVAAQVAALAGRARVPVLLDAGSWKEEIAPVLPRVEVAACSADFQPPGAARAGDDPLGVATALHRRGVPTVLVTDGPKPVVWSTLDGGRGRVAVPAIRSVDTLGAGDVFHGAFAVALAVGVRGLPAAIGFAVEVAGLRCARLGARAWLADPALDALTARVPGLWRGRGACPPASVAEGGPASR